MDMTAARPGDQATLVILAMQAELTALGLLPPGDGMPAIPRAVSSRRGRKVSQPCGTEAAATRHRRRHEPVCGPCRDAEIAAHDARAATALADPAEAERRREVNRERLRRYRTRQKGAAA
jgi:hypothetical protein